MCSLPAYHEGDLCLQQKAGLQKPAYRAAQSKLNRALNLKVEQTGEGDCGGDSKHKPWLT